MLEQLRNDYRELSSRVATLESGMTTLETLRTQYAALGIRVAALESPPPNTTNKTLLTKSDFTYLGTYPSGVGENIWGFGVTHRYVNGVFEIVAMGLHNGHPEPQRPSTWRLPSAFNEPLLEERSFYHHVNFWGGSYGVIDPHQSIWHDEQTGLIWSASTLDYPQGGYSMYNTAVLAARRVPNDGGSCTDWQGWRGFEGIGSRAAFGKPQRVPAWFRAKYNLPEFVSISGGYSSLAAQGLGASFGPMFFFFPDPFTYPHATVGGTDYSVPASDVVVKADFRNGAVPYDWYSTSTPHKTTFDNRHIERAARVSQVHNYYDAESDPRGMENPPFPPATPPLSTGNWLSPCPDDPQGYGRWTWGDSFNGSGNWIDNPSKHGIVAVATVGVGKNYYSMSAGHNEGRAFELHVYDPEQVATLTEPWKLRPSSLFALSDLFPYIANNVNAEHIDATFDATTGKLYLQHYAGNWFGQLRNLLHVYQVT